MPLAPRHRRTPPRPHRVLPPPPAGKTTDKTATGLTYIPAPKLKLPGHEESYNPPKEYLPSEVGVGGACTAAGAASQCAHGRMAGGLAHARVSCPSALSLQEERNAQQLLEEEERPAFMPAAYDCLRRVPAYEHFIKERFERCLDLYLCPRTRRKRLIIEGALRWDARARRRRQAGMGCMHCGWWMLPPRDTPPTPCPRNPSCRCVHPHMCHADPEVLVPKLPKPKDLQPFPVTLAIRYTGHTKPVRSLSTDATGQWLLSGGGAWPGLG